MYPNILTSQFFQVWTGCFKQYWRNAVKISPNDNNINSKLSAVGAEGFQKNDFLEENYIFSISLLNILQIKPSKMNFFCWNDQIGTKE